MHPLQTHVRNYLMCLINSLTDPADPRPRFLDNWTVGVLSPGVFCMVCLLSLRLSNLCKGYLLLQGVPAISRVGAWPLVDLGNVTKIRTFLFQIYSTTNFLELPNTTKWKIFLKFVWRISSPIMTIEIGMCWLKLINESGPKQCQAQNATFFLKFL